MHDASTALNQVADEVCKLDEAIGHENGDAFAQRTQAWADVLGQAATNAGSAARGVNAQIERQIEQLARLKSTEQDLLDQIAQENGDSIDARHRKALDDLKAEATTQDGFDQHAYNRPKKLEDQLHEIRLKNIKEQQQAQSGANGGGSDAPSASAPSSPAPSQSPAPQRAGPALDVTVNAIVAGTCPAAADDFARWVADRIEILINRGRRPLGGSTSVLGGER